MADVEANAAGPADPPVEASRSAAPAPPAPEAKKKGRAARPKKEKEPAVKFGQLFRFATATDSAMMIVACIGGWAGDCRSAR